ncbi:hypothetical protein evm_012691 [Chilo suppressalis]|nr:hypothetical protein evm_012691 [Chilo suppressalis]
MTQFLPPNLLALFAARDPIPYLPPAAKLPHEKKQKGYDGVGAFLNVFEHPSETPPPTRVETREERMERRRRERAEQTAYKLEQEIALWDPAANARATTDPFKTLFVARINYDTSESKLRREFEGYGPIKKIYMIFNKDNDKPRGYAFIEYEHERDMHSAYKHADGKKIDGKRVLVDVERARTVKGWLPRRLAIGGPIQAIGGPIQATGGPIQATGGPIQATGGPIQAIGGPIQAIGGPIQATGGPIQAIGGPIHVDWGTNTRYRGTTLPYG